MTRPVREPEAPRSRAGNDSGAIAVYVALMLPVLLIFTAIAVDISRWYVELQRVQRAADAGALAAAPFMPSNLAASSNAYNAAASAVAKNGSMMQLKSVDPVLGRPTQVSVTVESTIDNGFARAIGLSESTLTRTGTADFAGPVAMGSPCNLFGREDMEPTGEQLGSVDCSTAGSYWVNIAGTNTNKARGDGFSSSWCTRPDTSIGPDPKIDRCDRTDSAGTNPGRNLDWKAGAGSVEPDFPGYVFKVRAKTGGALTLEGYDIGWVATGDNCEYGGLVGVTAANSYVSAADAVNRYKSGNSPFCTGDTIMALPEGDRGTGANPVNKGSNVVTVVTVRGPSANPYTPLEGPVLCELTLPGWNRETLAAALQTDDLLARTYHRWANILQGGSGSNCGPTLSVSAGDDYSIQVQTFGGGGQNRFAIRASLGSKAVNTGVSIFAVDRVSLFNNVPAGTSRFNLVRLDSSAAAHTLNVRFYDLGDATDPVSATVLQPDSLTPYVICTGEGPVDGVLPVAPVTRNCTVTTRASTNGGRWQTIKIPIAQDYTCSDDDDQSKCWVRIELDTTAAQSDTTTWAADLEGDPVRLVD